VAKRFAAPDGSENRVIGIPLGLEHDSKARFNLKTGDLKMINGSGLNCATFVVLMFDSAKIKFIDFTGWQKRDSDREVQIDLCKRLAVWVGQGLATVEHLNELQKEIGCDRVRPEEVVGTCLLKLPAKFDQIEPAGKAVVKRLREQSTPIVEPANLQTQSGDKTDR
jgi:hypothetical protein